jgi:hypothetical protein
VISFNELSSSAPKSGRTDDSPFLDFVLFAQETVDLGL